MVIWDRVSGYNPIVSNLSRANGVPAVIDEILLSSEKTVAIIDGSGVLADPAGLHRDELVRLATKRIPVSNFDTSKLSKDGYLVKVEDQDVKLPCKSLSSLLCAFWTKERLMTMMTMCAAGEVVADGTDFRNTAHLRFKADLFVPCGGRYVPFFLKIADTFF